MNPLLLLSILLTQITNNRPKIDIDYAMTIATINMQMCVKYNVDCRLITAIQAQESRYRLNIRNPGGDVGIMQVSAWNIKRRGLNAKRLLTDLEYSIEQGVRILSEFKYTHKGKELKWWCRYNIGTRTKGPKLKKLCNTYIRDVLRYYPKKLTRSKKPAKLRGWKRKNLRQI